MALPLYIHTHTHTHTVLVRSWGSTRLDFLVSKIIGASVASVASVARVNFFSIALETTSLVHVHNVL